MNQRIYAGFTAFIFLLIAMGHLSRLIVGWDVELAGWVAPLWVSIPGLVVSGVLSAWGFKLTSRPGTRRKYSI